MSTFQPLRLSDLLRTDFRTSTEGDALNSRLMRDLGFDYRYQPARLAISLSLADVKPPATLPELLGKPIRGETLFGAEDAEIGLWVALIVEHSNLDTPTRRQIIDLVAGHWQRGARLIARRMQSWEGNSQSLVAVLAGAA